MDNRRSFFKSMGIGLVSLLPLKLLNSELVANDKPNSDGWPGKAIPLRYDTNENRWVESKENVENAQLDYYVSCCNDCNGPPFPNNTIAFLTKDKLIEYQFKLCWKNNNE